MSAEPYFSGVPRCQSEGSLEQALPACRRFPVVSVLLSVSVNLWVQRGLAGSVCKCNGFHDRARRYTSPNSVVNTGAQGNLRGVPSVQQPFSQTCPGRQPPTGGDADGILQAA